MEEFGDEGMREGINGVIASERDESKMIKLDAEH